MAQLNACADLPSLIHELFSYHCLFGSFPEFPVDCFPAFCVSSLLNALWFSSVPGRKFWGFPLFAGDCASGHKTMLDQKSDISELCSQMMLKLHDVYDASKVCSQELMLLYMFALLLSYTSMFYLWLLSLV